VKEFSASHPLASPAEAGVHSSALGNLHQFALRMFDKLGAVAELVPAFAGNAINGSILREGSADFFHRL
jgi:hypothetical protein